MTDKRFKTGRGTFWDKDKRLSMPEALNLLNELHDETKVLEKEIQRLKNQLRLVNERNYHINHCINEALRTERTKIGQSVLKQLKEAIQ